MIVGISGKKQSGKNTVAKIWQLLDVWYNTEERTNFDGMMSDTQYVEYMLEDDKISYNKSSWQQKSFAHKIKQITCILLGCTMGQLEDTIFKETTLGEEWWVWKNCHDKLTSYKGNEDLYQDSYLIEEYLIKPTPRTLMQLLGTDFGRDMIHPDIWIITTFADYNVISGYYPGNYTAICRKCGKNFFGDKYATRCRECAEYLPNWIISDVRFFNEAKAIKDREGILIRVGRDSDSKDSHVSENELNNYKDWNYVIDNNYSLTELILRVRQIMFKEEIIYE